MFLKIETTFFLNLTFYFYRKQNYFFSEFENISFQKTKFFFRIQIYFSRYWNHAYFPRNWKNIFVNWVAPVRFRTVAFWKKKQKIQSLTNKSLLSQLPGRYVFTVFYLNTSLRCIRRVLIESFAVRRTAVALKHNVYEGGGLYRL